MCWCDHRGHPRSSSLPTALKPRAAAGGAAGRRPELCTRSAAHEQRLRAKWRGAGACWAPAAGNAAVKPAARACPGLFQHRSRWHRRNRAFKMGVRSCSPGTAARLAAGGPRPAGRARTEPWTASPPDWGCGATCSAAMLDAAQQRPHGEAAGAAGPCIHQATAPRRLGRRPPPVHALPPPHPPPAATSPHPAAVSGGQRQLHAHSACAEHQRRWQAEDHVCADRHQGYRPPLLQHLLQEG